jgi:hypothetical protein
MIRQTKHLKVLACEVACREIGFCAARSPNIVDAEFLPVGHHDEPKKGHLDLQSRIQAIPGGRYDAILVGYGICNLMLSGLAAHQVPLVIPRAHDCITFFLGSKDRYQEVFNQCPGTYYFTAGWLEFPQRKARAQGSQVPTDEVGAQASPFALGKTFAELVAKYGEDNARYLLEVTEQWTQKYQRGLFIQFDFEQGLGLSERVAEICRQHGWQMSELKGDLGLLQRWLDGQWDATDFLVVQPGQAVSPTYNGQIIEAR